MQKKLMLKKGAEVEIRPLTVADLDMSLEFFRELPEEDREYLRVDVTNKEIVENRIRSINQHKIIRLIAIANGKIVADGSLESESHTWKEHIAELRMIVARPYQRMGLGTLMSRELFALAASKNVEEIMVKFAKPQAGIEDTFKKLGFRQEAVLHNYVTDIKGKKHDLILMRCELESLWQKLEHFIAEADWQRSR
ncbi:MAG: GNAT family N-acetyltransferase [candidate division Zixibacteria bacterium]|nr:GNAT family N-acetyltransferase [candidate division Zixibacteria bacterium]